PMFFELCVNTSLLNIVLCEISLIRIDPTSGQLKHEVDTDGELFAKIYESYYNIRKQWWFPIMFRPTNIKFVHFHLYEGHRVGIFDNSPDSIPPECEVVAQRYHYHECPLYPLPPMDYRSFLHFFGSQGKHTHSKCNLWLDRLPKKVGNSIKVQHDPNVLQLGWGVHIVEGPNWLVISWTMFGLLLVSFLVSLIYALAAKSQESGFGIGQWIVGVLSLMAA
ncbi:uncharacterized protein BDZ99DRAFT_337798, partial [Mytilinidion resinicola]